MLRCCVDDARDSNQRLLTCGQDLEHARRELLLAQSTLATAEKDMAEERLKNASIHAELAPLLNRLPTV